MAAANPTTTLTTNPKPQEAATTTTTTSAVPAAPAPGGRRKPRMARLQRRDILKQFLAITRPEDKDEPPATELARSAYRRIGAAAPRVVYEEPERFFRSAPTVFCH